MRVLSIIFVLSFVTAAVGQNVFAKSTALYSMLNSDVDIPDQSEQDQIDQDTSASNKDQIKVSDNDETVTEIIQDNQQEILYITPSPSNQDNSDVILDTSLQAPHPKSHTLSNSIPTTQIFSNNNITNAITNTSITNNPTGNDTQVYTSQHEVPYQRGSNIGTSNHVVVPDVNHLHKKHGYVTKIGGTNEGGSVSYGTSVGGNTSNIDGGGGMRPLDTSKAGISSPSTYSNGSRLSNNATTPSDATNTTATNSQLTTNVTSAALNTLHTIDNKQNTQVPSIITNTVHTSHTTGGQFGGLQTNSSFTEYKTTTNNENGRVKLPNVVPASEANISRTLALTAKTYHNNLFDKHKKDMLHKLLLKNSNKNDSSIVSGVPASEALISLQQKQTDIEKLKKHFLLKNVQTGKRYPTPGNQGKHEGRTENKFTSTRSSSDTLAGNHGNSRQAGLTGLKLDKADILAAEKAMESVDMKKTIDTPQTPRPNRRASISREKKEKSTKATGRRLKSFLQTVQEMFEKQDGVDDIMGWEKWSACSRTCGKRAFRSRQRTCGKLKNDGFDVACPEPIVETEKCVEISCHGNVSRTKLKDFLKLNSIEDSHTTVRPGVDEDQRVIDQMFIGNLQHPQVYLDNSAVDYNGGEESNTAGQRRYYYTLWSSWSACTRTCGQRSYSFRKRYCVDSATAEVQQHCGKPTIVAKKCRTQPCPVNGGLSSWSKWSACSAQCGITERHRSCTSPKPAYGGKDCAKLPVQVRMCGRCEGKKYSAILKAKSYSPKSLCGFDPCQRVGCLAEKSVICVTDFDCNPIFFNHRGKMLKQCSSNANLYLRPKAQRQCSFNPCKFTKCDRKEARCLVDTKCRPFFVDHKSKKVDCKGSNVLHISSELICGFNPCSVTTCTVDPDAKCVTDYRCNPLFVNAAGKIIAGCTDDEAMEASKMTSPAPTENIVKESVTSRPQHDHHSHHSLAQLIYNKLENSMEKYREDDSYKKSTTSKTNNMKAIEFLENVLKSKLGPNEAEKGSQQGKDILDDNGGIKQNISSGEKEDRYQAGMNGIKTIDMVDDGGIGQKLRLVKDSDHDILPHDSQSDSKHIKTWVLGDKEKQGSENIDKLERFLQNVEKSREATNKHEHAKDIIGKSDVMNGNNNDVMAINTPILGTNVNHYGNNTSGNMTNIGKNAMTNGTYMTKGINGNPGMTNGYVGSNGTSVVNGASGANGGAVKTKLNEAILVDNDFNDYDMNDDDVSTVTTSNNGNNGLQNNTLSNKIPQNNYVTNERNVTTKQLDMTYNNSNETLHSNNILNNKFDVDGNNMRLKNNTKIELSNNNNLSMINKALNTGPDQYSLKPNKENMPFINYNKFPNVNSNASYNVDNLMKVGHNNITLNDTAIHLKLTTPKPSGVLVDTSDVKVPNGTLVEHKSQDKGGKTDDPYVYPSENYLEDLVRDNGRAITYESADNMTSGNDLMEEIKEAIANEERKKAKEKKEKNKDSTMLSLEELNDPTLLYDLKVASKEAEKQDKKQFSALNEGSNMLDEPGYSTNKTSDDLSKIYEEASYDENNASHVTSNQDSDPYAIQMTRDSNLTSHEQDMKWIKEELTKAIHTELSKIGLSDLDQQHQVPVQSEPRPSVAGKQGDSRPAEPVYNDDAAANDEQTSVDEIKDFLKQQDAKLSFPNNEVKPAPDTNNDADLSLVGGTEGEDGIKAVHPGVIREPEYKESYSPALKDEIKELGLDEYYIKDGYEQAKQKSPKTTHRADDVMRKKFRVVPNLGTGSQAAFLRKHDSNGDRIEGVPITTRTDYVAQRSEEMKPLEEPYTSLLAKYLNGMKTDESMAADRNTDDSDALIFNAKDDSAYMDNKEPLGTRRDRLENSDGVITLNAIENNRKRNKIRRTRTS